MESLAQIESVDATWVLPGHGPAWDGGVPEAVRLIREAAAQQELAVSAILDVPLPDRRCCRSPRNTYRRCKRPQMARGLSPRRTSRRWAVRWDSGAYAERSTRAAIEQVSPRLYSASMVSGANLSRSQ